MRLLSFILLLVHALPANAFSSGAAIAKGARVLQSLYCGRKPLHRVPFHLNETKCGGQCLASTDVSDKYTVSVSTTSYWENIINVTVASNPKSSFVVKGFAVAAVNSQGTVVGTFEESNDTVTATCNAGQSVEGTTIFHRFAHPNRTSITLQWTAPGQNFHEIKFRTWIVHSHENIFYLESVPLFSQRDGSSTMNLVEMIKKLMGAAAKTTGDTSLDNFENTFMDRHNLGYSLEMEDPFQSLRRLPKPKELIPNFTDQSADVSRVVAQEGVSPESINNSPLPEADGGKIRVSLENGVTPSLSVVNPLLQNVTRDNSGPTPQPVHNSLKESADPSKGKSQIHDTSLTSSSITNVATSKSSLPLSNNASSIDSTMNGVIATAENTILIFADSKRNIVLNTTSNLENSFIHTTTNPLNIGSIVQNSIDVTTSMVQPLLETTSVRISQTGDQLQEKNNVTSQTLKSTVTSTGTVTQHSQQEKPSTITEIPKQPLMDIPRPPATEIPKSSVTEIPRPLVTEISRSSITQMPKPPVTDIPSLSVTGIPRTSDQNSSSASK